MKTQVGPKTMRPFVMPAIGLALSAMVAISLLMSASPNGVALSILAAVGALLNAGVLLRRLSI